MVRVRDFRYKDLGPAYIDGFLYPDKALHREMQCKHGWYHGRSTFRPSRAVFCAWEAEGFFVARNLNS
ncbi:hypothetical protein AML91_16195 [Paenibacillus jilunlii]|uniref:Uncharacterized protein n=1 Tax=Paenibacillus jilunlii TaxID=682956 RepID=A0ABR5STD8_9BACL|nr:hypothetical protein AML91_16195 [Paenibacillus jilunlii]